MVDESGSIVWPDQVLLFLAGEVLRASPGTCIVADVKSSRLPFEGIARLGGRSWRRRGTCACVKPCGASVRRWPAR